MKRCAAVMISALLSLPFIFIPLGAKAQTKGSIEEEIIESGPLAPSQEIEEGEEPEEYEEEEEAIEPTQEEKPPGAKPAEEGAREGEELRQVVIDSFVNLNYIFSNSSDSFILKYHMHMEGNAAAATAVIKGNAQIATEVTGFLAKWPTGSCKLVVNLADTPFELTFKKSSEDKASIDLKFTNPITEVWESQCNFQDAPGAKFNTKGDPEKWLAKALEKARPPLNRLTVPISPEEPTTMKFEINRQTIKDPPLGSAELEGNGVITINPNP